MLLLLLQQDVSEADLYRHSNAHNEVVVFDNNRVTGGNSATVILHFSR